MNKTEFWLMNNPIRRASLHFEAKKLKTMCGCTHFKNILEIGCGEGQSTKNILRHFGPTSVEAIDLDPKMIGRAMKRQSDPRATFRVANAANLSFASNGVYDAVFDFAIIHHIPNWQECIREIHRVLKPGGIFLIEDGSIESFTAKPFGRLMKRILDHPYQAMYTKIAFEKELANAGFTVQKQSYLKPYLFWIIAKK